MSPRRSTRSLAKQTDARLVDLCRQGDERAFEAIVLRYRRELLGHCRRLGLSDTRAEDALQQALFKGWLALRSGTDVHDLRPWLRRIVHNTALNLGRSSREHREVDLDSPLVDAANVADTAPELRAAVRDTLGRVAALPAMQRDAMLLSAIEGRSHEEVASALGISHVAVRGLLYRARSTLRAGAGALVPAPLVGWATQTASRLATAGNDIAGWAAGGGDFGVGKAFVEAAVIAGTAAVAVGAVFGPFHTDPHSVPRASRSSASAVRATGLATGLAIQTASGPSHDQSQAQAQSPGSGRPASRGRWHRGTSVTNTSSTRRTRAPGGAAPIASPPGEQPKSRPVTGVPVALDAGVGTGTSAGKSGSGSGAGAGAGAGTGAGREVPESAGAPKSAEPPTGEHETQDGGSAPEGSEREAEAAREQHEREAEAAREKREREAETAREQNEREAEAAREQHEHEAEAAREPREREAGR